MNKIKVAHIITMLELGGAQQNTLFTVTRLNREMFEVILICGEGGFLDGEARKIPDCRVYFVKSMVRPVRPWKDFLCLFQLIRILAKENVDIVHTHSSKAGILGRIAAFLTRVPLVIHSIHGFGFNPYQKFVVRWLFVSLEKWIAKITHCLIAVSSENIKNGLDLGIGDKEKYVLIRSGVDIQKIKTTGQSADPQSLKKELHIPPDSKVVLNVSPFKIQKDPLSFVRLAEKVLRKIPKAQFIMVGDGELRPQIESLIMQLGLKDHIKLVGWRRNVPEILKMCDLFVLTSLWEGLPRAAVESYIVGKPVVAFAIDGLREIIRNGENGFSIPAGSLDEMSEKVILSLQDDNLRAKLSHGALKTIDESFDIYKMVHRQEDLYIDKIGRS